MNLVLDPATPFVAVDRELAVLGWQRLPDPTAPPSIIPGEPENASWRSPQRAGKIVYTFHPATFLRAVLLQEGVAAATAEAIQHHLPVIDQAAVLVWLDSDEITTALRGIQAAGVLREVSFIDPLNRLTKTTDPLIAREARLALAKILKQSMQQLEQIREALPSRRGSMTATGLFASIGDMRERRQILRWLMHDNLRANTDIHAVLQEALRDPDWELRMTAMLCALRLKDTVLREDIARVALPAGIRDGTDAEDRRILGALRAAVLALMDGQAPPPYSDEPLLTRQSVQAHLIRCALGLEVRWHERIFLLIYSLTEHLPALEDTSGPRTLPPGVKLENGLFWLGDQALVWVPSILHWIGDDLAHVPIENPIRPVNPTSPNGFLILCTPEQAITFAEAEARCQTLSVKYNTEIRLPTADEWEMAARGPDGRRFPWGNAYTARFLQSPSVWGMMQVVGIQPQWTSTLIDDSMPVVCGDVDQLRCSVRKPAGNLAALRFIVDFPT